MITQCLFVFEFVSEDSDASVCGVIALDPKQHSEEKEMALIEEHSSQIEEKYGVHDFSGTQTPDAYVFGYNTYEIHGENQKKCMAEWHAVLSSLGTISEVLWMSRDEVKTKYGVDV